MDHAQLEEYASRFPSMDGVAIGPFLRQSAASARSGTAIVELGVWLGAGTAQMALGLVGRDSPPIIHGFDRFRVTGEQIVKAGKFGVNLQLGQDTRPLVAASLAPFGVPVELHAGSIEKAAWVGGPISLHIDDATKAASVFCHALQTFGPAWIPGETILAFMDYDFWKTQPNNRSLRFQKAFIGGNPEHFEPLPDVDAAGTTTAFFRYRKAFDFASLRTFDVDNPLARLLPDSIRVPLRRTYRAFVG